MTNLEANVHIDVYQNGEVIATRDVHNIMCNTGRLYALKRLTLGTSDVPTGWTGINVFLVGDEGTTNPSDADADPLEPVVTQTEVNHEVLRAYLNPAGISYSPVDPNANEDPITLTVTSTLNSSDIDPELSYVNRISEAALVSANPSDSAEYSTLVYTTYKAIPFDRNESVIFNVTWSIFAARS